MKYDNVIPLFPSESSQSALERKLQRELGASSRVFSQSFLEDVYGVLILTDWHDDTMRRLIQRPNLLQEVAWAVHNDDVLSDFFGQRAKDLILELMEK